MKLRVLILSANIEVWTGFMDGAFTTSALLQLYFLPNATDKIKTLFQIAIILLYSLDDNETLTPLAKQLSTNLDLNLLPIASAVLVYNQLC